MFLIAELESTLSPPLPINLSLSLQIVEVDVGQVEWINSDYYDSVPAGDYLQRNIDDQLAWLVPKRPSSVEEPGPANNRLDIVINISASSRVSHGE